MIALKIRIWFLLGMMSLVMVLSPVHYITLQLHRYKEKSKSNVSVQLEMSAPKFKAVVGVEKEFLLDGMMYDVRKIEKKGDRFVVHAYADHKEVKLLNNLRRVQQSHANASPEENSGQQVQKESFKYISWNMQSFERSFWEIRMKHFLRNELNLQSTYLPEIFIPPTAGTLSFS